MFSGTSRIHSSLLISRSAACGLFVLAACSNDPSSKGSGDGDEQGSGGRTSAGDKDDPATGGGTSDGDDVGSGGNGGTDIGLGGLDGLGGLGGDPMGGASSGGSSTGGSSTGGSSTGGSGGTPSCGDFIIGNWENSECDEFPEVSGKGFWIFREDCTASSGTFWYEESGVCEGPRTTIQQSESEYTIQESASEPGAYEVYLTGNFTDFHVLLLPGEGTLTFAWSNSEGPLYPSSVETADNVLVWNEY